MKISIIVCTYNGERFITETINSVLSQSYKNYEIIIVDDFSNDNTKNIIKNNYKNISNVIISFNNKNYGLGYSRNKGISISKGEWITFLDQDDLYEKNRLEKLLNLQISNKKYKFFFHDTNYIDENNSVFDSHLHKYNLPYPVIIKNKSTTLLLKYGSYIDSEAIFFNRNIINNIGNFDEKLTYLCDYDFFLKISMKYDFFYIKNKLSSWRVHLNQQQKTNKNQKFERLILFTRYLFNKNTSVKGKFYCMKIIFINVISIIKDKFR